MNGKRMWNPACSVLLYLPRRSTMYALCCGTTIAVLSNTTNATAATTSTSRKMPWSILVLRFFELASERPHVQREAFDRIDARGITGGDRVLADVDCRPAAAAVFEAAG